MEVKIARRAERENVDISSSDSQQRVKQFGRGHPDLESIPTLFGNQSVNSVRSNTVLDETNAIAELAFRDGDVARMKHTAHPPRTARWKRFDGFDRKRTDSVVDEQKKAGEQVDSVYNLQLYAVRTKSQSKRLPNVRLVVITMFDAPATASGTTTNQL